MRLTTEAADVALDAGIMHLVSKSHPLATLAVTIVGAGTAVSRTYDWYTRGGRSSQGSRIGQTASKEVIDQAIEAAVTALVARGAAGADDAAEEVMLQVARLQGPVEGAAGRAAAGAVLDATTSVRAARMSDDVFGARFGASLGLTLAKDLAFDRLRGLTETPRAAVVDYVSEARQQRLDLALAEAFGAARENALIFLERSIEVYARLIGGHDPRVLRVLAERPAPAGRLRVRLTFSRPVIHTKAHLGGQSLVLTPASGTVLTATIDGAALPALASLELRALGADVWRPLDADPALPARFDLRELIWLNYAHDRPDTHHRVTVRPLAARWVSLLIDCSASMKGRLPAAKAAARRIVLDRGLLPDQTRIAVWCFRAGRPQLLASFDTRREAAVRAIDRLTASGATPLAHSMMTAGRHLLRHARTQPQALIVISDGAETEGGDPGAVLQALRKLAIEVRVR